MTDQQYSILPAPPEKSYRIQLIDMTSNKRYRLFVPVAALVVGAFTLTGCNSGNTPTVAPVADSTLPPVPLATDVPAPTFAPAPVVPAPADVPSTSTSVQVAPAPAPTVSTPATQSAPKVVTAPRQTTAPSAPAPTATGSTIPGEGLFVVGTDIKPGTYKNDGPSASSALGSCFWERLSATDGSADSVITADLVQGPTTVTILASDQAFKTTGCGTWKP
jgi:hypothetical protein